MSISDEEKRQIMDELVRGNPEMHAQEPSQHPELNDQNFEAQNYQNFDDFAQRGSRSELETPDSLKARITTDLNQAKEVGQLRAERVREIVSSAVFQVASEFKSVSSDIRLIVKDAVSAVIENLQEKGGDVKEEITASIEGAIEGISSWRRQSINKTQAEVNQLQARLDTEENELQQEIDRLLTDIEEVGKDRPPSTKASIESAINTLKNSEEVAFMQKRYAELQAQVAILRANLAARYGGRYEEVKEHLDSAKNWYSQTRPQAQVVVDQAEQKRAQLEEKIGDAGTALAKKERRIRQILSELLQAGAELLREKQNHSK
jgi:polyhydroxyalkanoate synthesis regulator phasin